MSTLRRLIEFSIPFHGYQHQHSFHLNKVQLESSQLNSIFLTVGSAFELFVILGITSSLNEVSLTELLLFVSHVYVQLFIFEALTSDKTSVKILISELTCSVLFQIHVTDIGEFMSVALHMQKYFHLRTLPCLCNRYKVMDHLLLQTNKSLYVMDRPILRYIFHYLQVRYF